MGYAEEMSKAKHRAKEVRSFGKIAMKRERDRLNRKVKK